MINSMEIFDIMFDHNIIVSYIGPFDGEILAVIAENIEDTLWENPLTGRKFFKIFIELAQNISLYSSEILGKGDDYESGIGMLVIKEFENHFMFYTGNKVKNEEIVDVINKCDKINTLDREGLREFKRQMRSLPHGTKGGGNIGLIQVALVSGYSLQYQLLEIGEEGFSFYIIGVRIDK